MSFPKKGDKAPSMDGVLAYIRGSKDGEQPPAAKAKVHDCPYCKCSVDEDGDDAPPPPREDDEEE